VPDDAGGPHSRACGTRIHPHGRQCHPNCPTCHGTLPHEDDQPTATVLVSIDPATLPPFVELITAAAEFLERPFNDEARDRLAAALAEFGG
jgi:hypothetical protein